MSAGHTEFVATFTVTGNPGEFSPEVYYLRRDNPLAVPSAGLRGHKQLGYIYEAFFGVVELPSGARIHVDLLGPDLDPTVDANWRKKYQKYTGEGAGIVPFNHRHARVRCVSGGQAGTATVDVTWTTNEGLR